MFAFVNDAPCIPFCKTGSFRTQNCQYWNAKLPVLERKTGSFRTQKWQFWNAKLAVLETGINCLGMQSAISIVLKSMLYTYYQPLILQPNCIFHLVIQYFVLTTFSTTFLYRTHVAYCFQSVLLHRITADKNHPPVSHGGEDRGMVQMDVTNTHVRRSS